MVEVMKALEYCVVRQLTQLIYLKKKEMFFTIYIKANVK